MSEPMPSVNNTAAFVKQLQETEDMVERCRVPNENLRFSCPIVRFLHQKGINVEGIACRQCVAVHGDMRSVAGHCQSKQHTCPLHKAVYCVLAENVKASDWGISKKRPREETELAFIIDDNNDNDAQQQPWEAYVALPPSPSSPDAEPGAAAAAETELR